MCKVDFSWWKYGSWWTVIYKSSLNYLCFCDFSKLYKIYRKINSIRVETYICATHGIQTKSLQFNSTTLQYVRHVYSPCLYFLYWSSTNEIFLGRSSIFIRSAYSFIDSNIYLEWFFNIFSFMFSPYQ